MIITINSFSSLLFVIAMMPLIHIVRNSTEAIKLQNHKKR